MNVQRARRSLSRFAQQRRTGRWEALLAALAAMFIYFTLPEQYKVGPAWLAPIVEIAVLVPLVGMALSVNRDLLLWQRAASILLVALINATNLYALWTVIPQLLHGRAQGGSDILVEAVKIWLTNVFVFALWYWEFDRGGPAKRHSMEDARPDFLFPQMTAPQYAPPDWRPSFIDYLFVSFTNASAFSPTDTLPLSQWTKLVMMAQALISLLTVALVAARAVNILS